MNMTVSNQQAENQALLNALPKKILPTQVNANTCERKEKKHMKENTCDSAGITNKLNK